MLAVTRKNKIKEILIKHKSITVAELSRTFDVTEETIRRDLKFLEDEGFLSRTYGGAFIQSITDNNTATGLPETACTKSKEAIARQCRRLIHNGDSIFLDASATALFIARAISDMHLTVVTNSLMVLEHLSEFNNICLVCIGGILSKEHKAFEGNATLQALNNLYFNKTFLSCRSLSMEHGVTDSSEGMAAIRQTLLNRSREIYLTADYSKFDKTSFVHICDIGDLTGIVTDKDLSQEWKDFLANRNTFVITC